MRNKFKDVDMEKVTKYMIEHDCKLDEAMEAVMKESIVPEAPAPAPTPVVETVESVKEEAKTRIKAMRLGSGMSQSQLAGAVGINVRTLQAYEQGYRSFDSAPLKILLQTALVLECRIEDIIEDPECIQLLKEYRGK